MGAYTNRDGTPKDAFVTGETVRIIDKKDRYYGRTFPVLSVRNNRVRLQTPTSQPAGDGYWSYEIEHT